MIDKKEEGMKHLFKSISGFIILAIFITGCATAQVQIEGYDFRNVKWGMGKEEVENSDDITEEGTDKGGNTYLITEDTFAELPCKVAYYFSGDKLIAAGYLFVSTYIQRNEYIDDYEQIKRYLINSFGAPDDEVSLWKDSQSKAEYESDYAHWGDAISWGQLSYIAE